ncbi:MAG: hypothetical protein DYG94_12170 [Leptolyngbya sp. PLA3]|nr:MAG: hypothetical protein EDM82_13710 [Cyanobacteria bacterium CYA]MCE7969481.1 hypothetical protein [Leptolyngbya sp. PL-A3]
MAGLSIVASVLVWTVAQAQPGKVVDPAQPETPAVTQPETQPEQPLDTSDLPEAEAIFKRYVEALGDPEALKKIRSIKIDGRYVGRPFEFAARLTIWKEYPNKFHLKIQEPAGETIEIGFDGEKGWERQPSAGLRMIEGLRLIELRDSSDFWGEANWETRYIEWKVLGRTTFEGQKAVGIYVKALSNREKALLFSEETGLYLGSRTFTVHPGTGKPAEFETVLKPYKEFAGVKIPMGMLQRFKGDQKATEFDYVKLAVNPEEKHDFSPPAELLEKIEREKSKPAEATPAAPGSGG